MEVIRPEAVRLTNGTELFISHDEAMRPLSSPSEVQAFSNLTSSQDAVTATSMIRLREDAMFSPPIPLHNRDNQFRWARYSNS